MKELEERILKNFTKKMKKEVEGLELYVAFSEDCWPDYEGNYLVEVMEKQDNGRVWTCECTRSGNIKYCYEL